MSQGRADEDRRSFFTPSQGRTVKVPEAIAPLFEEAERLVQGYFRDVDADPSKGHIDIGGDRYVLVRASALSIDFLDTICELYSDRGEAEALTIGQGLLFDIAHAIGINDARAFAERVGVTDPLRKLAAGPIHFAYTGWASVDIHEDSTPAPDDSYFLKYDHPFSFEADAWLRAQRVSERPVCVMNGGYSSGWCEHSFGLPLTAVEVECRAMGHGHCRFVMAPPHRVEEHLERLGYASSGAKGARGSVPTFFERKQTEDRMRELQSSLIAASRRAGVAEAATGVLHNIGNVLNSVNASVDMLRETLAGSQLERLDKTVALLDSQSDLSAFFAPSAKGQRVPAFLALLCERLHDERKEIVAHTERLSTKVEHLCHLVQAQQHEARSTMVAEEMPLRTLIADAVVLVQSRADALDITIEVECEDAWIRVDKQVLLQVLVNLLTNACDAVVDSMAQRRRIGINAATADDGDLVIEVHDEGCGIESTALERIFAHGFTTKADGHGFGLHSAANSAKRVGGSLHVDSRGVGKGAVFTLRIPAHQEAA